MKIRIYYGRPSQTASLENPSGLWSEYHAVYHMSEHPAGAVQRDRYGNSADDWPDGTVSGTPTVSTDLIAQGVDMNGTNGNYVSIGAPNVTSSQMTMQAFVNVDALTNGDARVISKAQGVQDQDHVLMISTLPVSGGGHQWRARLQVDGLTQTYIRDTPYGGGISADGSTAYLVAYTYDGQEIAGVINGEEPAIDDVIPVTGTITQNAWPAMIGNQPDGVGGATTAKAFDGEISEVRIAKVARDLSWLQTEYNLLTDPDAVIASYGAEVDLSGSTAITVTDSVTLTDDASPTARISVDPVEDTITLVDLVSQQAGYEIAALTDTAVLTDSLEVQQVTPVTTGADTVTLTDTLRFKATEGETVEDSVSLTDSAVIGATRESVTDTVQLTDSLTLVVGETLSDVLSLTDAMTVYPPATLFTISIREQIVKSILSDLNAITPSGFSRESGDWAYRLVPDDQVRVNPYAFVRIARESKREGYGWYDCTLTVEVAVVYANADAGVEAVVDQMITDIESALVSNHTRSNLAIDTRLTGHQRLVEPPDFIAELTVEVDYRHVLTNARASV